MLPSSEILGKRLLFVHLLGHKRPVILEFSKLIGCNSVIKRSWITGATPGAFLHIMRVTDIYEGLKSLFRQYEEAVMDSFLTIISNGDKDINQSWVAYLLKS